MGWVWVLARCSTRSPVLPVGQEVVLWASKSMGWGWGGDLVTG